MGMHARSAGLMASDAVWPFLIPVIFKGGGNPICVLRINKLECKRVK